VPRARLEARADLARGDRAGHERQPRLRRGGEAAARLPGGHPEPRARLGGGGDHVGQHERARAEQEVRQLGGDGGHGVARRRGAEGDLDDRQAGRGEGAGERHGRGGVVDLDDGHDGERLDSGEDVGLELGHQAASFR
jgi:hypothetical protein